MTAVLQAGFAELDGFGSVTQVDALDGEPSQGCGRQLCVACLGCQAEGVGVVALGEPAQFWGVAFVWAIQPARWTSWEKSRRTARPQWPR
ncbi:hypothetical protein ACFYNN_35275 [Streptomyces sp. NPDC006978]|uniref:hypothetical protein n=1 Tax=unclassified Streptomyces TaxID=2593676 RepID=UPI002AFF2C58|nr:hypothetical protein [Streptomyces sp. S584]